MTVYVPGVTEQDLKKVILALQQVASGRSNATGTVTLSTAATTVISPTQAGTIAIGSTPILTATSSGAAAEIPTMYVSAVTNGSFTVTHTVSSSTSRTFRYAILG
jgi:hypothetical protein